jgi:hypothetical protein
MAAHRALAAIALDLIVPTGEIGALAAEIEAALCMLAAIAFGVLGSHR